MKLAEKFKAIELRKSGFSYDKILREIDVSKSTLSFWLRDIEFTSKQQQLLLKGRERSRYVAAKAKRALRIKITNEIIKKSKTEVRRLIRKPLFILGLSLYWAEGAKSLEEDVKFSNSDPLMVLLIMRWFREICLVPEHKFRINLHVHDFHIRPNVEQFWSNLVKVPQKQFYKTYVKKSSIGLRKNLLYNGTCQVIVNNKELFRKIVGWKLGLQEYFNIRP